MKNIALAFLPIIICVLFSECCKNKITGKKIVAIPVYGQSLALGEEAELITNFDSLKEKCNHSIVTENIDGKFGYFSNNLIKQKIKKIIKYKKRVFELSCYGMAECLFAFSEKIKSDKDFVLCIFPSGEGTAGIENLEKGSKPYKIFLKKIRKADKIARKGGNTFIVPAFCWMQGENDIVWNTGKKYKRDLIKFRKNIEKDIKNITHQKENVKCILYQSSCLSLAKDSFHMNSYNCCQAKVPQAQMELIRDNKNFIASNPTYPYTVKREYVHIDGISQKRLGYAEGLAYIELINGRKNKGLVPESIITKKDTIIISLNTPYPPLVFDTTEVKKVKNHGFSVINKQDKNILKIATLKGDKIYLICSATPHNTKIRYGVNGSYGKSGNISGPRGNLRDSRGDIYKCTIKGHQYRLDNWCYIFDITKK